MGTSAALADAVAAGLYQEIDTEIDEAYMEELKQQSIHPEVISEMAKDFTIVYTPLHGTGNIPVRRVLKELGFEKVYVVPEQEKPDGTFPTVAYPNPESPKAFELALALAKKVDADIVLATDPDADRLGVYCKDTKSGNYVSFTGNMSGMLIAEYILKERTATGTMPENPALVETIVTTDMAKVIAQAYGVHLIEVLTGFKYIGEQIRLFEENHTYNYVFGLEESYGCLAGTYARDKDACVAVNALCGLKSALSVRMSSAQLPPLIMLRPSKAEDSGRYANWLPLSRALSSVAVTSSLSVALVRSMSATPVFSASALLMELMLMFVPWATSELPSTANDMP